jgi:hypothetical protein
MSWVLPGSVAGASVGFVLGFLSVFPLRVVGVDASGWPASGLGLLGALAGGVVGSNFDGSPGRGRTVARWCVLSAAVVGAVSFLAGFAGPILLRPDLPQGPLLGIFYTGPVGALAGAVLGVFIGLLAPDPTALARTRGSGGPGHSRWGTPRKAGTS